MNRSIFLFLLPLALSVVSVSAQNTTENTAQTSYLKRIVTTLAEDIGERNCYRPENLARTMEFIESEFQSLGYQVSSQDVIVNQPEFKCAESISRNIIAELPGVKTPEEILVIGAHFDTKVAMRKWNDHTEPLPELPGTPGADDNASGIAATLLLAKLFANNPQARTIRFVAFTNEEPPFFRNPNAMGSWVYAKEIRRKKENVIVMLSLETLGCYSEQPRSKLPIFRFLANRLILSNKSDYVAFLGDINSEEIMEHAADIFREASAVRLKTLALPKISSAVAWSDDWAFWQEGYKAFSVTDTAYLRHDHYHELTDTPDKLDYQTFALVVRGVHAVIRNLANEDQMTE